MPFGKLNDMVQGVRNFQPLEELWEHCQVDQVKRELEVNVLGNVGDILLIIYVVDHPVEKTA